MRCVPFGWPSKNYVMSNEADPHAYLACAASLAICHGAGDGRGVSQGRWQVSLTRWTAANPPSCHWISLMLAEPR